MAVAGAAAAVFASRALTGANLIAVGLGGVITALIFFLSLYLQQVNGYSPLQAGIALLAPTAAALLASMTSGRLVGRVGPRALLIAGPLLATLGQLWLSRGCTRGRAARRVRAGRRDQAYGLGSCFVPMTMCATAGVQMRDAGLASGIINSSRQVGGAVLLAALVTIATSHTASVMHTATGAEALVAGCRPRVHGRRGAHAEPHGRPSRASCYPASGRPRTTAPQGTTPTPTASGRAGRPGAQRPRPRALPTRVEPRPGRVAVTGRRPAPSWRHACRSRPATLHGEVLPGGRDRDHRFRSPRRAPHWPPASAAGPLPVTPASSRRRSRRSQLA